MDQETFHDAIVCLETAAPFKHPLNCPARNSLYTINRSSRLSNDRPSVTDCERDDAVGVYRGAAEQAVRVGA